MRPRARTQSKLSIDGIANLFPGAGPVGNEPGEGNDFVQGTPAWFVVLKCDSATGGFTKTTDSSALQMW